MVNTLISRFNSAIKEVQDNRYKNFNRSQGEKGTAAGSQVIAVPSVNQHSGEPEKALVISKDVVSRFLLGPTVAAMDIALCQPIDNCVTQMQTGTATKKALINTFLKPYRGAAIKMLQGLITKTAVFFCKPTIDEHVNKVFTDRISAPIVSGISLGSIETFLGSFLSTAHIKLLHADHGVKALDIIRKMTLGDLFKGNVPACLRGGCFYSVFFPMVDQLNKTIEEWKIGSALKEGKEVESSSQNTLQTIIVGGVSAAAAALPGQPFDILTKRIRKSHTPLNMREAIVQVIHERGITGLWRGLPISMGRMIPAGVAIALAKKTVDYVSERITQEQPKPSTPQQQPQIALAPASQPVSASQPTPAPEPASQPAPAPQPTLQLVPQPAPQPAATPTLLPEPAVVTPPV